MPLPWKKAKISRISRFVADLQSPPKCGGSLVVETGFPTSLVDLFVKNRDRLKKQCKKKSQAEPQMEISRPVNVMPPPTCYSNREANSSTGREENVRRNVIKRTTVDELVVVEECAGSKKRRVLVAVLRVFLVVVLALCSKRLAMGITKSAFLLLFLEFVWTRSNARTVFDCFVGRVKLLGFCKCKNDEEEIRSCEKDSTGGFSDCSVCDSSNEKIEVVDSKYVAVGPVDDIKTERKNLEVESGDRRERGLVLEKNERILDEIETKNMDKVDVSVGKKETGRRGKMKAKLKKFVPKKLWKKDKKCKEKEMNSSTEVCSEDHLEVQRNGDKQDQDVEEDLSRSLLEKEEESCNGEVSDESQAEANVIAVEEPVESEREGNSGPGYLILCLIVLAGLFGGRVLALVLTVCWCFMLKLTRKLRSVTMSS